MEVRIIEDADGKRRVIIFQRQNGTYGFEVEKYSDDPYEQCWIPYGRYSEAFCDSEETALKEATGRVSWLAGQKAA